MHTTGDQTHQSSLYHQLTSPYLFNGLSQESYAIDNLLINEEHATALCSVISNYSSPTDSQFHLSFSLATLMVQQIGVIYAQILSGYHEKTEEVFLTDYKMNLNYPVRKMKDISIHLSLKEFSKIPSRKGNRPPKDSYLWDVQIENGDWTGQLKLCLQEKND